MLLSLSYTLFVILIHLQRKITEENDDKLLKSGLPADVMSLVESVTAKKKVADENVPQPIDPGKQTVNKYSSAFD